MKIETKYNVGQEVWTVNDKHAKRFIITAVMVVESLYAPDISAISIKYKGNIIDWTDEADCYLTKEELIDTI